MLKTKNNNNIILFDVCIHVNFVNLINIFGNMVILLRILIEINDLLFIFE